MKSSLLVLTLVLLLTCCDKNKKSNAHSPGTPLGQVDDQLEEASGLVASVKNPGLLWVINDSGNPAEVFLIDQQARTKLICTLKDVNNRDWEDIAIGAGPKPGVPYLYVADIGDNFARYDFKFIYRFEEPLLTNGRKALITQVDTLTLQLPDGKRDAEALLIDPLTHDLYIVSKREKSVSLYHAPFPFPTTTIILNKIMVLPFTRIVSGSISTDGMQVLLKDYEKIYYWKRLPSEPLAQVFNRKPIELPYEREYRGEAIAWSRDGHEFFTLSEGNGSERANLIRYYKRDSVQ